MLETVSQRMLSRRRRPSSRKARLPSPSECINPMSCSATRSRKAVAGAMPSSLAIAVGPAEPNSMSRTRTFVWRLVRLTSGAAAAAEIVLDRQHSSQELQRLARDRQPGAYSADDLPLPRGRGGEAGLKGAVLMLHPGSVIGDADRLAVVEDGDHDVEEVRMEKILHQLLDDGVWHLPSLLAAVVVGLLGQRSDERRQVVLLDGDHARWAGEGVVDRDARSLRPQGDVGKLAVRVRVMGARAGSDGRRVRSPRRGLPGGGPLFGEQPVEERLHRGAEYTRAPAPSGADIGAPRKALLQRNRPSCPQGVRDVWIVPSRRDEDMPSLRELWIRRFHREVDEARPDGWGPIVRRPSGRPLV